MRALFILNPLAGHGRAARRWERLIEPLRAGHKELEVWHTAKAGDGAALARRGLEQGFEAIIAAGGDGTLGEVVDGFLSAPEAYRSRAAVGHWPAGSGCDTARHLGLSPDEGVERLLAMLRARRVRRLDAGRVYCAGERGEPVERHFVNVAALGLAGDVARQLESAGKRWGGTGSYLLSSVRALLAARASPVQLTVDGRREPATPLHLAAVANSPTFGGGMTIAPGADMADGWLELVTVGDLSRWMLLRHLPGLYRGGALDVPGVARRKVRRVEAASQVPVFLNIDGEALGRLPAVFEVLPAVLPFLLPA